MSESKQEHDTNQRAVTIRALLDSVGGAGSCFQLNALPRPSFCEPAEFPDDGFCWFPQPLPTGMSIHLTSSRLSQQLEDFPGWFDALRTFACSMDAEKSFLLTAEKTTTDRFVRRIGELFAIPVVNVKRFPKKVTEAWIDQQRKSAALGTQTTQTIWVEASPERSMDALMIRIASEVRVLRVRNGGNVHAATMARLESNVGRTWVLVDECLSKPADSQQLIDAGAAGWWLYGSKDDLADQQQEGAAYQAAVILVAQVDSSQFAIHWTRRRRGPWPDQTDPAYLDDLIFRSDSSQHHALASLRRILITQRIIASSDLTRDSTPVVCLADVLLTEIEQRRTFRSHLGRWDFEPYGIAIKKDCLRRLGAAPVIYGNDSDWNNLSDADRPFFQLAVSKDGKQDWRSEQEIRLCGDLPLKQLNVDDAIVFVPSHSDAAVVALLSRWPVVVLGE